MKTKSKLIWIAALGSLLFIAPASGATPTAVSKTVELVELDSFIPLWVVVLFSLATIALLCFSMKLDTVKSIWANCLAFLTGVFAFCASFVTGTEQAYILPATTTTEAIKNFADTVQDEWAGAAYTLTTVDGTSTVDTVMQLVLYENIGLLLFTAAVCIFSLVMLVYSILQLLHEQAKDFDNETGL